MILVHVYSIHVSGFVAGLGHVHPDIGLGSMSMF